jgi:uncharacterized protein (DUF342 family)
LYRDEDADTFPAEIDAASLSEWISSKGITHGIKYEVLNQIVQNPDTYEIPAVIAKGQLRIHGEAA